MRMSRSRRRRGGFTLIEVLLVLVILVILASLVVGGYSSARKKANLNAAKAQIGLFESPLKMYEFDVGAYPTTEQGLESLRNPPGDLPNPDKWGPDPYLEKNVPLDPWDNPYQYEQPGRNNPNSYDLWSFGPDGIDGTDDDVGNWEQE
ncbi:MAG: type II secretion system major pseudopilin GspG [Pirellulales bacterium]|nr:type II secretion system major pseudopilin GspG [Pirellulales bacterium]